LMFCVLDVLEHSPYNFDARVRLPICLITFC